MFYILYILLVYPLFNKGGFAGVCPQMLERYEVQLLL